ncbi:MAG: hypothetical protein WBD20_15720 [Pirellulaceae bacterium]
MVEISAPRSQQQIAVGAPQVDSEAITEEAIAADLAAELDPTTAPRGFGGDAPAESPDPLPSNPLPPTWQSERTKRSRQIGLVVAVAGSGLIVSILAFGWFVKNWPAAEPPIAEAVTDSSVEQSHANAVDSDVEPAVAENSDPDSAKSVDPQDPKIDTKTTVETDVATPHPVDAVVPVSKADSPIPTDLMPNSMLDPLGLDASTTKDTSFPNESKKAEPDSIGKIDLPPEAKKWAGILNLEGGIAEPKLAAPATLDDIEIEGPSAENIDPMMIANPPEPINFKAALAMKLAFAAANNGEYPLNDLALLISQISGVPIQVDWVSFDLCGVDIRDGVKGNSWLSIEELLERIAKSVGGEITKEETFITLAPTDEVFQGKLDELIDCSDFGPGRDSAIATVNAFLVGEGRSGANAKQIKLGEERHDQQVAALAIESMRRMRGVKGKIPDSVLIRWAQSATDKQLDWPVVTGGKTGKALLSPLAIAGLLRRLSRENDATCFVNWFDANRRGMAPQQLVMPFMNDDAGEVLATTLKSFELQVRRVDQSHWWVGTEATYDRFPVLVWTPPLGKSNDEFARRITAIVGADETKLAIDPDTGRALLLLPRYIVRQLPKLLEGLK